MFKKVINAYNVSTGNRREKAKKQACSGLLVASTATGSVRDPVSRHKTEINRAGHLTPSSSFNMCTFLHSANLVHLKAGNETQQPLHSLVSIAKGPIKKQSCKKDLFEFQEQK